ncbi:MAG: serine/threonine-protein kinase [Planctomycetota bacterium]|nr:serine/threonine-protein kinase [Planctomycetota bacterium]
MRFVRGERTLEVAIDECGDLTARLELLDTFLRVCDTVAFAHERGVLHRDLKPANVGLGRYGEAVLLDWGLARLQDRPDLSRSQWKSRIRDFRDEQSLETLVGGVGTPGFMAPELLLDDLATVDERADVYSLGAILFRILTQRLPFDFKHFPELIEKLRTEEPRLATESDPAVPEPLAAVCRTALYRDRARRFESVDALAEAVRNWQHQRGIERQIEALILDARANLKASEGASGETRLHQLGRVEALADRILGLRANDEEAGRLKSRVAVDRTEALRQRDAETRRRTARRGVMIGLLVVSLVSLVALLFVADEKNQKGDALRLARARGLVGASAAAQSEHPQRSLLLAREAARLSREPEVVSRLHEAVFQSGVRGMVRWHRGPDRVFPARSAAVLSANGTFFVTALEDHDARLWARDGSTIADLSGHKEAIFSLAISPAGSRIGSASLDGTARLWDSSGKPIGVLGRHEHPVVLIRFLDEDRVLTADEKGAVHLWSIEGESIATIKAHKKPVLEAAIAPSAERIVTASMDASALILDFSGAQIASLEGHKADLIDVQLSPDGTRVATASADGTARIWKLDGDLAHVLTGHQGPVATVRFSGSGKEVLTASVDGTARLYQIPNDADRDVAASVTFGNEHLPRASREPVRCAIFSASGHRVVTGMGDGTLRVWDLRGRELRTLRGHHAAIQSLALSADGQIISSSDDGTVRFWEPLVGQERTLIDGATGCRLASYSPTGRFVLFRNQESAFRIYDTDDRALLQAETKSIDPQFLPSGEWIFHCERRAASGGGVLLDTSGNEVLRVGGKPEPPWKTAVSPGGERLLTMGRAAKVWTRRGELLATLEPPSATTSLAGAVFAPSGRHVFAWIQGRFGVGYMFDESGTRLAEFRGPRRTFTEVRFSPTGSELLTASEDRVLRIWGLDGTERVSATGHEGMIRGVEYAPDGRSFVSCGEDRTVRLWNATGSQKAILRGHTGIVYDVAFSPSGALIASASADGTARLWTGNGQEMAVLRGHADDVFTVAFSPDGRRLLTASRDGTAREWVLPIDELLELAAARSLRELTEAERRQYAPFLGSD